MGKMKTEEKKDLCNKINISLKTYYNWEKEKPYLIKLIELGLKKELEEDNPSEENLVNKFNELEHRLNILEAIQKK